MDESKRGYQEYPVQISLRVMGEDKQDFTSLVFGIASQHIPNLQQSALSSRRSRAGTYISITITFTALSQEQYNTLFRKLSEHERVLMVL
jgi:uncharacterized protein